MYKTFRNCRMTKKLELIGQNFDYGKFQINNVQFPKTPTNTFSKMAFAASPLAALGFGIHKYSKTKDKPSSISYGLLSGLGAIYLPEVIAASVVVGIPILPVYALYLCSNKKL